MNRIFTFVIGRELSQPQLTELLSEGRNFVAGWTAHDNRLKADFSIFRDRVIVVSVDESASEASGCSIDKLTRFMKEAEKRFDTPLLDRLLVPFFDTQGKLQVSPQARIREMLAEGSLGAETMVLNTAASNSDELDRWAQPLKDTWLSKYLQKA